MKQANIFGYVMGIVGNSHFRFDVKFRHEEDSRLHSKFLIEKLMPHLYTIMKNCIYLEGN